VTTLTWNKHRINLVDTPGHVDFTIEVERALRVLDGAVAVFDATVGVQAQTLTVWRQAAKHSIPTVGFVNKMDRDGANLEVAAASIRDKLGITPLLLHLPLFERGERMSDEFVGVVDLIRMRRLSWDGVDTTPDGGTGGDGGYTVVPLGPEHGDLVQRAGDARTLLAEALADLDDDFAERLLEDDADPTTLPASAFLRTVRRLTLANECIPLLCGAARRTKGIQPLMDAVVDFLPSPLQRPPIELESTARRIAKETRKPASASAADGAPRRVQLKPTRAESLCCLVFKIVFDPHRGPLAFVRVYSGVLRTKTVVANSTQGGRERITKLLVVHADHHTEVDEVSRHAFYSLRSESGSTLVAWMLTLRLSCAGRSWEHCGNRRAEGSPNRGHVGRNEGRQDQRLPPARDRLPRARVHLLYRGHEHSRRRCSRGRASVFDTRRPECSSG
jgi:elongation factor G